MPRPKCSKTVCCTPHVLYYKPKGIPSTELEEVALTLEEFEAVRLADYESFYQEKAADSMKISRQTFGRIISSARSKIAQALVEGKALSIRGEPETETGNKT